MLQVEVHYITALFVHSIYYSLIGEEYLANALMACALQAVRREGINLKN